MEPEVQLKRPSNKKRKTLSLILTAFILIMISAASVFAYMTLSYDKVYKGITIGSLDASGMGRDELKKALEERYQSVADQQAITLKTDRAEVKAGFPDLGVRYDTAAAVDRAYAFGRSGTVFDRFYDIASAGINGISLNMPQTFDKAKVDRFVDELYQKTLVKVNDGALLVTDTNVTLRSGNHGENIDKVKTAELIKELIDSDKSGVIRPEVVVTPPSKFNVDDLYRQIESDPVDAAYTVENNKLALQPHKVGRKIDKAQLDSIVAELEKTENTERVLPVVFAQPKITSEMATSILFKDELASWHTSFATGTTNGKNRGYNMSLAIVKINEMVLAPGQEFSYNDVVGPRDLAHGFKLAHVYSAGKIIDGAGGGICQVSSTMYSAILRADLEVTERRNHSFTVGYVPLGQDATAYYGGTDFRFKNSTKWPIKLLASIKGNKVYFSILGTNDNPGKTVIISSKILSQTPYTIKYLDDPTLPAGVEKEKLPGMNGYVVETYKTVKQDGKVISQTKLHTSVYKVYAQEMLRGTKPGTGKPGTAVTAKPATPGTSETVESNAPSDTIDPSEVIIDEAAPTVTDTAAEPGSQTETKPVPAP